jgi:hypothetical protein
MRRYLPMWNKHGESTFQTDQRIIALRELVVIVRDIAKQLDALPVDGSLGKIWAKSALSRLEASFSAALGLIRREYVFETDAVVRLVLEQIAWSYAVFFSDDKTAPKLNPTKCISRLKQDYPESGPLYGNLSELAHIDPSIAENYTRFHEGRVPVVRRSAENSFESGKLLFNVARIYLKVVEQLFAPSDKREAAASKTRFNKLSKSYFAKQ